MKSLSHRKAVVFGLVLAGAGGAAMSVAQERGPTATQSAAEQAGVDPVLTGGARRSALDRAATEDTAAAAEAEAEAAAQAAAAEQAAAEQAAAEAESARRSAAASRGILLDGAQQSQVNQSPERRLDLRISQGFSADSDPGRDESGAGFTSTTAVSFGYLLAGPTETLRFSGGISMLLRTGEGYEDSETALPLPNLALQYTQSVNPAFSYNLGLSGSVTERTFSNGSSLVVSDSNGDGVYEISLVDQGEDTGFIVSTSASAGARYVVNRRDSLSGGLQLNRIEYIDGAATDVPMTGLSLRGAWNRQLSATLSAGFNSGISASIFDEDSEDDSFTFSAGAQGSWTADPRTTVSGSIGPRVTYSDALSQPNFGVAFDTGIRRQTETSAMTLSFSNAVTPTTDGDVTNVTSLRLSASQTVSPTVSVSGGASLSRETAITGATEDNTSARINAALNYRLTEHVTASLSYRTAWEEDDDIIAHRVMLNFTRALSFIP